MNPQVYSTPQVRIDDPVLTNYPRPLIVWWYGPLRQNTRARSVPHVVVIFRSLDENGNLGHWLEHNVALTHLGLLRIGSVWRQGLSSSRLYYPIETFDVSFSDGGWSCSSPFDAHGSGFASPIPNDAYPLKYAHDRNYLLRFNLDGGGSLLVPCMEFFYRCYGHSAEVKRVLATYPWQEASDRLFKAINEPVAPGTWPVRLGRRMRNDDVVFLAHVKHDEYARRRAKSIYSQAETAVVAGRREYAQTFLKVAPWYRGPAKIKVAGVRFDGGQTFLALQILGASQPQGEPVIRDRENPGGEPDGSDESDSGIVGGRTKVPRNLPEIIVLTDADEPDHGSMPVDIVEDRFEVLGAPRAVVDKRHDAQAHGKQRRSGTADIRAVSSGEPHGSDKGVGYGSIHAQIELESSGVLRDMWNAARKLQAEWPEIVQSVLWFTFEDGFSSAPEPKLIGLKPFVIEDKQAKGRESNWVYHDPQAKTPRGVLVLQLCVGGRIVHLIEIQRRVVVRKRPDGEAYDTEENFRGLIFSLESQEQFRPWLSTFLDKIRLVNGIVSGLAAECPGEAHAFNHSPGGSEKTPGMTELRNALSKLGIRQPRSRKAGRGQSRHKR
ncbi:MAG TPA: hypothetical protein VFN09_12735 [Rhodanobacteraceae bacterium]|nr:hypothetical protein [Rhodanobacteraceae bacterium]